MKIKIIRNNNKPVYCWNCIYNRNPYCASPDTYEDNWHAPNQWVKRIKCEDRNKNNDCEYYNLKTDWVCNDL